MTIGGIISVSEDRYVSRRLLQHILGLKPEELVLKFDTVLSSTHWETYSTLLQRVMKNKEPLAYVLGYELFCGYSFEVDPNVLIPRAESEYLVKYVVDCVSGLGDDCSWVYCDVGTGSGCVGVSSLLQFAHRPMKSFLLDVSPAALSVAKQNLTLLGSRGEGVACLESDLLSCFFADSVMGGIDVVERIVISANLPYVPDDFAEVEEGVARWEPGLALYSGVDGLDHYRRLLPQIQLLEKRGLQVFLFMEMMTEQVAPLMQEIEPTLGGEWEALETFHERIVMLRYSTGHN